MLDSQSAGLNQLVVAEGPFLQNILFDGKNDHLVIDQAAQRHRLGPLTGAEAVCEQIVKQNNFQKRLFTNRQQEVIIRTALALGYFEC